MKEVVCENDNHMIGFDFDELKKHQPKPPALWENDLKKKIQALNERFGYKKGRNVARVAAR